MLGEALRAALAERASVGRVGAGGALAPLSKLTTLRVFGGGGELLGDGYGVELAALTGLTELQLVLRGGRPLVSDVDVAHGLGDALSGDLVRLRRLVIKHSRWWTGLCAGVVSAMLARAGAAPALADLELRYDFVDEAAMLPLAAALGAPGRAASLRSLRLGVVLLCDAAGAFGSALGALTGLVSLHLDCRSSRDAAHGAAQDAAAVRAVASGLARLTALEVLSLQCERVVAWPDREHLPPTGLDVRDTAGDLGAALARLARLRSLATCVALPLGAWGANDAEVEAEAVEADARHARLLASAPGVQDLRVAFCAVSGHARRALLRPAFLGARTLADLRSVAIDAHGGPVCARTLLAGAAALARLESLQLSSADLRGAAEHADLLRAALARPTRLALHCVRGLGPGLLAAALGGSTRLRSLSLFNMRAPDEAGGEDVVRHRRDLARLVAALPAGSMRSLQMHGCGLSDDDAPRMSAPLRALTGLTHMDSTLERLRNAHQLTSLNALPLAPTDDGRTQLRERRGR